MTRFVVANEQNKQRRKSEPRAKENPGARLTVTALRVMRPPQIVRVELRDEQPVRVYLRGMRGEVVAASGPWRSSGDWWQEDTWQQDEWDLEIEFVPVGAQHRCAPSRQNHNSLDSQNFQCASGTSRIGTAKDGPRRGLYRIYYDALRRGWFVRGEYD
jgi:hypothetical protein